MSLNKEKLIAFIKDKATFDYFDEDTLLFSEGNLDSVSQLEMIGFIEEEAGIIIDQFDITLENFDSVSKIMKFIDSKLASEQNI